MQSIRPSSFLHRACSCAAAAGLLVAFANAAAAGGQVQPRTSDSPSWSSSSESTTSDARRSNQDDSEYAYTGPFIQGALSIGRIDFDGSVDSDASGGFGIGGGYRALPWLAAEIQFQFLGGQENANFNPGGTDRDSEFFAFTVGPKVYPLGLFEIDEIPDNIQPYGSFGIGGGEGEIEGRREKSTFVARFILGVDVWFTEHLGAYVEGGGYAVEDGFIDGVGTFNVGASWRF